MTTGRLITLMLAIVISALVMTARSVWYDSPVTIEPGRSTIDITDDDCESGIIHVRMASSPKKDTAWGIIWNYKDDNDYMAVTLSIPRHQVHNDIYPGHASVSVERVKDGSRQVLYASDRLGAFDTEGDFNSLKLIFGDGHTRIVGGNSTPVDIYRLDSPVTSGEVMIFNDEPVTCRRITSEFSPGRQVQRTTYASIDAIYDHLAASSDIMEGTWQYLDRKIDANKAALGGRYTLLTVKNGDGYDIIYLSGADINTATWTPLMLKGRLRNNIFLGNYDMEWYSADGTVIDDDTNAQLSDDGAILTLRFPALGSQIRLSRVPAAR